MRKIWLKLALIAVAAVVAGGAGMALSDGWQSTTYNLGPSSSISHTGQAVSGSTTLTIVYVGQAHIHASADIGQEQLTCPSGDKLTTQYKLTGPPLGPFADGDWVAAGDFVAASRPDYIVTGPGDLTLSVQATAAAGRANDAGPYSASLTFTLSW